MQLGDIDLTRAETFAHEVPHEYFDFLRREHPVSYVQREDGTGFWSIVRHADIEAIEKDPTTFSNTRGVNLIQLPDAATDAMSEHMLVWTDAPRHTFLRRIISRGFTPKAIDDLRPLVERMAEDAVDAVIEKGACDFTQVAAHLPVEVIAELMGVPERDRVALFDWTNRMFGAEDPEQSSELESTMAMMEIFAYARRLAEQRRAEPTSDVFSVIANATEDGEQLSELDLACFFLLLALAGNETTRTLLLHAQHELATNPAVREEVLADRSLIPGFLEELLRMCSPVHGFGRTTTKEIELHGQKIPAGEQLVLWYAAGNRDPEVFEDPHQFNLHRDARKAHQGFGARGPHYCLGAALARMEGEIMLNEMLDRIPDVQLAGPVERLVSIQTNGIKRMPVTFTPGTPRRPASERPHRPYLEGAALLKTSGPAAANAGAAPVVEAPPAPAPVAAGETTVSLIPLATATLELGAPVFLPNGPKGTRVIAEVTSAVWEGERLRAKQCGASSADWALVSADGIAQLDVRATLETEDGALIYVHYEGRTDYAQLGAAPLFANPLFETGDPRYAWLNKITTVAKGRAEGLERLVYDIYEVR